MGKRTSLDRELQSLKDDILRMGSLVASSTRYALGAFTENDHETAQRVIDGDDEIDLLHHRVESAVAATIALQQPKATDLRQLIAILLIANELERMGDHAEGIAKTIIRYSDSGQPNVPPLVLAMSEQIGLMVHEAMEAFINQDAPYARQVAAMDDRVDAMYSSLFETVVQGMGSGEVTVELGTYLLWAGHNLERIADRVTNICERVYYASTGEIDDLNEKRRSA